MNDITFLGDLQRLEIKPGDRFVLSAPGHLSADMCERLQEAWAKFAGGKVEDLQLLILEAGAKLGVINTGTWSAPPESERPEGFRCVALVEVEWQKDFSGSLGWLIPEEYSCFKIDLGAPGVHGFQPLPMPTASANGGDHG